LENSDLFELLATHLFVNDTPSLLRHLLSYLLKSYTERTILLRDLKFCWI